MKRRKIAALFLMLIIIVQGSLVFSASATEGDGIIPISDNPEMDLNCTSAVLMDAKTGSVIFEKNKDEALPPASVTKIMTLLLVAEAIDDGRIKMTDTVTASAHAASMGGSQVFLKEGEQMSVEDMLKSVIISSANDAAVALAEHISGSEAAFVSQMNKRAAELGMKNTNFENTNGLDDTVENHRTSAYDIALMSQALIKHKFILQYSSTWMDTIRGGAFGLTNTNRLVRFYKGCTGLKTGSTAKAGFCVSVTAERDGTSLICVVMGAPNRDVRNNIASNLLDYGFSNYATYTYGAGEFKDIKVAGGKVPTLNAKHEDFSMTVKKTDAKYIEPKITLPDSIPAPVKTGDKIGEVEFYLNSQKIGSIDILSEGDVERVTVGDLFGRIMKSAFCM